MKTEKAIQAQLEQVAVGRTTLIIAHEMDEWIRKALHNGLVDLGRFSVGDEIDARLLTREELLWLNGYHARVLEQISPQVDAATQAWLKDACAPLT